MYVHMNACMCVCMYVSMCLCAINKYVCEYACLSMYIHTISKYMKAHYGVYV